MPTNFSAIDVKLRACSDRNSSNPGVSNCTVITTAVVDRRLNETYSDTLRTLNQHWLGHKPEIAKRSIAAERTWIAFRDAECDCKSTIVG